MIDNLKVIASFELSKQHLKVDGEVKENLNFINNSSELFKSLYKSLKLSYPKFHKMDLLSKAVMIGDHFITKSIPVKSTPLVLLFNESSSMQSDLQHIYQYSSYETASPGIFVYTLPNICVGELCIKNKWNSPSSFLLMPRTNFNTYLEAVLIEMKKNQLEFAFTGFVEVVEDDIFVVLSVLRLDGDSQKETAYQFYKKALSNG